MLPIKLLLAVKCIGEGIHCRCLRLQRSYFILNVFIHIASFVSERINEQNSHNKYIGLIFGRQYTSLNTYYYILYSFWRKVWVWCIWVAKSKSVRAASRQFCDIAEYSSGLKAARR